jgi:NAD-dependent dihydropyrimidine dehydrogenase PreA subunit
VCPVEPKVMELKEIESNAIKSVIVNPQSCDFGAACIRVCPTGAFKLI